MAEAGTGTGYIMMRNRPLNARRFAPGPGCVIRAFGPGITSGISRPGNRPNRKFPFGTCGIRSDWIAGVTTQCVGWGDVLFRIGKEVEVVVTREPPLPVRVVGFEASRPDLLFVDWDGGRDLYVDVVGTSPLAASYWAGGGDFVPGGACYVN
jgi:hypothetical protein